MRIGKKRIRQLHNNGFQTAFPHEWERGFSILTKNHQNRRGQYACADTSVGKRRQVSLYHLFPVAEMEGGGRNGTVSIRYRVDLRMF